MVYSLQDLDADAPVLLEDFLDFVNTDHPLKNPVDWLKWRFTPGLERLSAWGS